MIENQTTPLLGTDLTDASGGEPLLEVSRLKVSYPVRRTLAETARRKPKEQVRAVDDVSFVVRRGEILALVGESGCGKTTTAKAVVHMVPTTSGTITFGGADLDRLSNQQLRKVRGRMQMIYQDPYESLDPRFRVRDTIEEPLLIHGVTKSAAERRARVVDAMTRAELVPVDLYLERYPQELSGGQRQRVAIAASLVLRPELLVADEPVSMLDVSVRAEILRLLDRLRRDEKLGILLITHDLSTAAEFADRIAVMYLGRIVEEGPTREILARPRHPYTSALVSVVPSADPRKRQVRQILQGETPNPINIPTGCRFRGRCPLVRDECALVDPELHSGPDMTQDHRAACILV